jgi:sec-independent protein translocase protein TatC
VAPGERLPVTEHLGELRHRLIVSIAAMGLAFAATYAVHGWLVRVLVAPAPHAHHTLVTLSPTEPFMTTMKVCFWAAVLLALPVWLYQLYAFVVPAFTQRSRRLALTVVGGVASLFAAGVAFGYFFVLGVALRFLLGFGGNMFQVQLRAGEYFSFATTMLLACGLVFEVPVAMVALARLGVLDAAAYWRHWRVALVVIAAIAAVLPGGDPFSMMLLMLPQIVLYAVGACLAGVFGRPSVWRAEQPVSAS